MIVPSGLWTVFGRIALLKYDALTDHLGESDFSAGGPGHVALVSGSGQWALAVSVTHRMRGACTTYATVRNHLLSYIVTVYRLQRIRFRRVPFAPRDLLDTLD